MPHGEDLKRNSAGRDAICALLALAMSTSLLHQRSDAAEFPEAKFVEANGIKIAYYEMGEGFPVVFSHGFPEMAYSWRNQLGPVAAAGFRAIALDQRGYGLTDRPEDVREYNIHKLTGDLVGLLDALGIEKAVFCGHDWGGIVVWMMGVLHPDRVAGVIGINTPFIPRGPIPPLALMRQMRGENNYIVAFQEPGVADAILAKDVRKTFSIFLRTAGRLNAEDFANLPPDAPERNFELLTMIENDIPFGGDLLVSEEEMQVYVEAFERTGFTGGINWYRNLDYNWETTAQYTHRVEAPSLYIGAEDDVVLPPSMADSIETFVPNIEKHVIQDCGHWTQQEKPEELNTILIGWLTKTFGKQ